MTLDELRRLAALVQPLPFDSAPPSRRAEVLSYNVTASRFRELVTVARNTLQVGMALAPSVADEIRGKAAALPAERRRVAGGLERPRTDPSARWPA